MRPGNRGQAYLARWALSSGRSLGTVRLGSGPLVAVRLIDRGARLMVVSAHDIATYNASTLRQVRALTIRPVPLLPSAAAISPDGSTLAPNGGKHARDLSRLRDIGRDRHRLAALVPDGFGDRLGFH